MKIFGLLAVIFLLYVSSASAADTCGVCKNLATTVKTLLANNETSSQIKSQLLRICNFLGPYSAQCTSLVEQNFDTIVALVEKYDDPTVVCQKIGLCPQLAEAEVGGFDKCSVCHFLVGVGESWIERNSTEQDIFKVLEGACKIIPGAYGAVCRQMIETFGPKIVQALLNRENPDTICKQIHLCTATLDEVEPVPVYSPADVNVKGAAECYVCKLVIGYIENFVKSNSTEQEIIKEAEKVCSILPGSIKSICDNIVSNYVPQVINLLLQKVPPASICAHLKLCTSSVALDDAVTVAEARRVGSTKYCQICQYVVTSAENFLGSQSTESEIAALAGKICGILPSKFSSVCKQFVSSGLPLAMKYILAKETPQVACAQIKLCSSAKTDFIKMNIQQ